MNDYRKIIDCLMNQIYYWRVRCIEPSRIIVGIEIVKILKSSMDYWCYQTSIYESAKFMGLSVTIDYENRWIMMVCAGNESDGRYWLNKE